jgi:polysaccharide export outer membrane protein
MRRLRNAIVVCCFILAGTLYAADTFPSREQRYVLHPGDTLTATYRYTPDYNATVSVHPDGYASFPNVGSVKIGGLTVDEANALLTKEASKTLRDPVITLDLKTFEIPYVIVGGEVIRPGRIEFHGNLTVLRAIETAGGPTHYARSNQVLLVRPINGVDAEVRVLDLKRMLTKHDLSEDLTLRAGDLLVLPESRLSKVDRIAKVVNYGAFFSLP